MSEEVKEEIDDSIKEVAVQPIEVKIVKEKEEKKEEENIDYADLDITAEEIKEFDDVE